MNFRERARESGGQQPRPSTPLSRSAVTMNAKPNLYLTDAGQASANSGERAWVGRPHVPNLHTFN